MIFLAILQDLGLSSFNVDLNDFVTEFCTQRFDCKSFSVQKMGGLPRLRIVTYSSSEFVFAISTSQGSHVTLSAFFRSM